MRWLDALEIGDTATIRVLDAASGRTLLDLRMHDLRMHDQRKVGYKADARQSMPDEINAMIGALDSDHAPE